jgi:hypothetical protein
MRGAISVKKPMFTIFFPNRKLLIAEDLPKGQKYNRDDLILDTLPELERGKMTDKQRKQGGTFCAYMSRLFKKP